MIFAYTATGQCDMDRHNTNAFDGWVSCNTASNPNTANGNSHWIMYDLGENKSLYASQFWNINHPDHLDWGIRTARIEYSLNGTNWIMVEDFSFPQATGVSLYSGIDGPDFGGITARYLLVTALNNYGGGCSGFSELKIYTQDEQLPAGLATFTGKEVDCNIKLEWRTITEQNTQYFEIEKSTDGITFTSLTRVSAVGNSSSPINYRHVDANPSDENYYRLRTVDADGSYEYSDIISVASFCYEGGVVEVFPNPVSNAELLNIRFHSNESVSITVEIMDGLGRVLDNMEFDLNEGVNNFYYDAKDLPAGMYSLRFEGATWLSESRKFIKVD